MNGKQYEVISQVDREDRDETFDLKSIYVPGRPGRPPVALDKVVHVSEASSPPQLFRPDRYLSATISPSTST